MIHSGDKPLTAHVAAVNYDGTLNLAVLGADGVWHARSNVPVVQAGDEKPTDRSYVEWMPFQVGQAQKTAEAEAEAERLRLATSAGEAGDVGAATEGEDRSSRRAKK